MCCHGERTKLSCVPTTDCRDLAILNGVFPDKLKLADLTPLYKKVTLTTKPITYP